MPVVGEAGQQHDPLAGGSAASVGAESEGERTQPAFPFEEVIRRAFDAIVAIDAGQRIDFFDAGAERMFGYRAEEVVGQPLDILIPDRFVERYRGQIANFAASSEPARPLTGRMRPVTGRHRNGQEFPFDAIIAKAEPAAGRPTRMTVFMRDVSELRRAEDALQRREAYWGALVERSSDAVMLLDERGLRLYVSPAASQVLGHRAEELLGDRGIELLHPDDITVMWGVLAKCRAQPELTLSAEFRVRQADGSWRWCEGVIKNLLDDPDVRAFVVNNRDITERKRIERALHESREHFLNLLQASPVGVYETDAAGRCTFVNERWCAIAGLTSELALGEGWINGVYPEDRGRVLAEWQASVRENRPFYLEYRFGPPDHHVTWVLGQAIATRGEQGEVTGYIGTITDISERKHAQETLHLAAKVFENSREAIVITDADRRIVSVNRAFEEVTGYSAGEVIGRNPSILASLHHDAAFYQALWQGLEARGHWAGEIWDRRKNGEIYPSWLSIVAVRDSAGRVTHYVGIASDMTERKRADERISFLAQHDILTGLPNRVLFRERLEQAMAEGQRQNTMTALLFLDLDHFKVINDSLGHLVGDRLLQAVAQALRDSLRDTDIVSRQGGDEFLVGLADMPDLEATSLVAEKILERLARPFDVGGHVLSASTSIGISVYPADGEDFETLLRSADTALFHAKQGGRGGYRFFTEQMNVEAQARHRIETALRRALEFGELALHYQPQVELATGRIVGAEALLRWTSRELGEIPPVRFIPIAEEAGLIIPIGDWVLHEACRQARAWEDEGLAAMFVSVNLSALQLRRGNLVDSVTDALRQSGLQGSRLELELTESILMQDTTPLAETLRQLDAMGVMLSIDDFGTGYSSLSYLKRFAVDKLKVDQSFVRDLNVDPDDASIVRAVVRLGQSLGLQVIAEGVEQKEQRGRLIQLGCALGQGNLFSPPLPAAALASLLRAGPIEP